LQRIYGTAFFDKKGRDGWLKQQEETKKRDHRKLCKELDLFAFHPAAPGAVFWTHRGTLLFHALSQAMRNLCLKNGYQEIKTPLLYNKLLWERSGHWGKYRENMFLVLDPEAPRSGGEKLEDRASFSLKPMNCPSHHLMYEMKKRSYRELPLRYHTQDVLHRNEATGVLSGLTRVRQFQQDDAHIYLMESQITDEVKRLTEIIRKVYTAFGLSFTAKFATRPPQRIGADATWDRADSALRGALGRLSSVESLLEVARGAADPELRASAVRRISDGERLRELALQEAAKEVALAALTLTALPNSVAQAATSSGPPAIWCRRRSTS